MQTRFFTILVIVTGLLAGSFCPASGAKSDPATSWDAASPITLSPIARDWALQDHLFAESGEIQATVIQEVVRQIDAPGLRARLAVLEQAPASATDQQWMQLYLDACQERRKARLQPVLAKWKKLIFVKHDDRATTGANHFAYTEGVSDHVGPYFYFFPGSSICILELDDPDGKVVPLLDDPSGLLRDPELSFDGRRLLFAWKKSARDDDYHLYEMDLKTRDIRQLTSGKGFADYDGIYLPNGNILFSSTRCVQSVSCDYNEVSNFYLCDRDGKLLRRVGFDQVHTLDPSLMDDGSVLYTRWEYNDRSQVWPQALFRMNPDGTGQTEFYGNNAWCPTSILHARVIPGTSQCVGVVAGHHTHQMGKLALIDRRRGTRETDGMTLIAPVREAVRVQEDRYAQAGELYRHPYPVTPTSFLVSLFAPTPDTPPECNKHHLPKPQEITGSYPGPFGLYYIDLEGRRELLASDPKLGCYQAIPWAPRPSLPVVTPSVDYRKQESTFFVQDIYAGQGLSGVPRGTVKKIRVVTLNYKLTHIGRTEFTGEGGSSWSTSPVAIGSGTYETKVVLGTTDVQADGSASFIVPSRTPVYFQALDAKGHVVQTMRSWTTLQPGETRGCVGCHESKHAVPTAHNQRPLALAANAQPLKPFRPSPRGFSYREEIQPILDKHCVSCHDPARGDTPSAKKASECDLTGTPVPGGISKRIWSRSYLTLTQAKGDLGVRNPLVNWLDAQCRPTELPPYFAGAAKSRLLALLEEGHEDVQLSSGELETIACWIDLLVPFCGTYDESNAWSDAEKAQHEYYVAKRASAERQEQRILAVLARQKQASETSRAAGHSAP